MHVLAERGVEDEDIEAAKRFSTASTMACTWAGFATSAT